MKDIRKKIIFFIQNGVGGAERMTINIAKLLPTNNWDIIFCKVDIPCRKQNGRIEDFIPRNSSIMNVSWSSQIAILKQFYQVINNEKPDFVFSSVMPYNQRLLLLSLMFRKTKFIIRNDNYLYTISKHKRWLIKLTYRFASKIIAQTEEMKSELIDLGLDSKKILVLHNFIDEDLIIRKAKAESPFPNDSKVRFVSVGRIAPQKGYDILIKAFKLVSEEIPNSELYIIGDYMGSAHKSEYLKLRSLIQYYGLINRVIFTGYTENPYRYIKNSSAYVLSSRFEGLPNVLIEAQFLGIPSAATKCIPIISRMIKNGENGILAENENPESLANAMIDACQIKNIKQIYKPSSKEDFINLFNTD